MFLARRPQQGRRRPAHSRRPARGHRRVRRRLFVLREQKRICAFELESHHALTIARGVGETRDITLGAGSGKAILAYLDEKRRDAILGQVAKARRAELAKALETVRNRGFATSESEVIVGAVAFAAPTFNFILGEVAGCVGVFGPRARVKDSDIPRFGALVMQAANAISLQFGYGAGEDARQD